MIDKKFKKGDRVSVLDENITGIVKKVKDGLISILTEDDFIIEFSNNELIKIEEKGLDAVSHQEINDILLDKETDKKPELRKIKRKEKEIPPMEVDLHIQQLVSSTKGLTNYDILTLQLETARKQLEFAINKRIPRVVFVHGVGEGILRTELEYLFSRYENVKFYDANYQKYGIGATEVYIFQNAKS